MWHKMKLNLGPDFWVREDEIVSVVVNNSQEETYQIGLKNGHTFTVKDHEVIRKIRLNAQ